MPAPIYRILACVIPVQAASLLAFAWYSTRPPAQKTAEVADRILVRKSEHTLTLFSHNQVLHTYKVALGRAGGDKEFQGDHKTPVGLYSIDGKNPRSQYHLALHLSYPNAADRARAAAAHRPPGGDVEIHGLPPSAAYLGGLHRAVDWTDGCIAVTDAEVEEIYKLVPMGTPVEIDN